jgi:transcriptional regulator with XRE-family HTH domain
MEFMNSITALINTEIDRRDWSLRQVAEKAHVSHTTIVELANGSRSPTLKTCRALASAFNLPVEEVIRMAGLLDPPGGRPVRDSRRVVYEVNADEVLLQQYHALRPEDQDRVRDLIARLGQIEPRIIGERPEE